MSTDREEFMRIVNNIDRSGVKDILPILDKTDFYTAPASTKYHHSVEGGLVKHSLEVFNIFKKDAGGLFPYDSIAITSLFHDLCKIAFYKVEMRNTKNEFGKWVQVPYYTIDDAYPFGHGEKSVYMLREYIKLTDEEAMAIRWHMGGFDSKENQQTVGQAFEKFPLALYLHVADLKSCYLKGEK